MIGLIPFKRIITKKMKNTGNSKIVCWVYLLDRSHLEFVNEKVLATQTLLASLQSSENYLTEIEGHAQIVAKKTEELHHVCEGLVSEEVSL